MNKLPVILAISALGLASAFSAETKSTAAAPTDPQIALIAVTADTVDIEAGKLAASKTTNAQVKEFAELMIRDHTSVNEQATALAKRLNVTPEESATSKSLKADGDKMKTKLEGLSGAAFDKAYVDNEVAYHQTVLDALDKTLIPNAKNADLKGLLESVRPVIASHLDHAKMIQKSVK
jgi:putative membrane protein